MDDSDCNMPNALGEGEERERRLAMLDQPRMKPLVEYLQRLRQLVGGGRKIPNFDPCDGGVDAKFLLLMAAPGGKAGESGFVSRNNPDQPARMMLDQLQKAGLSRRDTLLWNVVPWYPLKDEAGSTAKAAEMAMALPHLALLFADLKSLRAVVLLGKVAQLAQQTVQAHTGVPIYRCALPSLQVKHINPAQYQEIGRVLAGLKEHL